MSKITIKPFHDPDVPNKYIVYIRVSIDGVEKGMFPVNTRLGDEINISMPDLTDNALIPEIVKPIVPIKDITWKTQK